MKKERVKNIGLCGVYIFLIATCLMGFMLCNPFKPVVGVCTSTVEVSNIEECGMLSEEYIIEGIIPRPEGWENAVFDSGFDESIKIVLLEPSYVEIYTKNKTMITQISVGETYRMTYKDHVGNVSINYKREMVKVER